MVSEVPRCQTVKTAVHHDAQLIGDYLYYYYYCCCYYNNCVSVCTGMRTGRCVPSDVSPHNMSCEVVAWCPVERDELPLYAMVQFLFYNRKQYIALLGSTSMTVS